MAETDRPLVPSMAREIAERAVAEFAQPAIDIVELVASERDRLRRDLEAAQTRLTEAEQRFTTLDRQFVVMTQERDARPTKDELEAARRQVTELQAEVERLQTELDARPQNPDQVLDLIRAEMQPVLDRMRERAQG